MKQPIRDILVTHPTEFGGLILQGLSAGWGGWVALPWLDTFKSARSYDGLASVMDEGLWGLVVLFIALWNLWLLHVESRRWRSVGWFVSGVLSAFMGYEWVLSNLASAFVPCFFVHSLGCFWMFYRLRADVLRPTHDQVERPRSEERERLGSKGGPAA